MVMILDARAGDLFNFHGGTISREDVAHFVVNQVRDNTWLQQALRQQRTFDDGRAPIRERPMVPLSIAAISSCVRDVWVGGQEEVLLLVDGQQRAFDGTGWARSRPRV
jgi:hypothetical protein